MYCRMDTNGWLTEIFADEFADDGDNDGGDDNFEVERDHVSMLQVSSVYV